MESLEEYITRKRKSSHLKTSSLPAYLNELMGAHAIDSPKELYEKAQISKQAFYRIMGDEHYSPSIEVVTRLALALHLDNRECKYLMKKAGYTLPTSSDYALTIRYCLDNKIYDIEQVNALLSRFDKEI